MSLNERILPNQLPKAVTGFTGAAPQTVKGNVVVMNVVERGTLSADAYALATTNTLTITAKWQVSSTGKAAVDGDWTDCAGAPNNPADVPLVTGTGAPVTATKCVPAPAGVYGKRYARLVLTSGVGVGGGLGQDEASVSYNWTNPSGF